MNLLFFTDHFSKDIFLSKLKNVAWCKFVSFPTKESKSNLWYLRAECYEKLLQIQFRVLRERNLYPERRLKVIDIHIKRGKSVIIFAEIVIRFAETMFVHGGCAIRAD